MEMKAQIVPVVKDHIDKNGKRQCQNDDTKYDKALQKYEETSRSPHPIAQSLLSSAILKTSL